MMTAPIAIALLGAVACIAIAVASAAMWRARAARRANEATRGDRVELGRKMEAEDRQTGDIVHDLNDLLTVITGHTELLIATLDPSGTNILDAYEIRRAALSAAQLTRALRAIRDGHGAATARATFAMDVPAPPERVVTPEPAVVSARSLGQVLVVEDEPGVRELIRVILARAGYEVLAVAGPHAALAALRRKPAIPLMLVDVVMPELGGYDLVTEARTIAPDIRVVFMSAFARDAARHSSGDGFLAKPFTAEALTDILKEALGGS